MKQLLLLFSVLILFSACFKEEDKRENISSGAASMKVGEDYGNQIFFNLNTQEVISENRWEIWNLAFYAQDDDFYIKLCHPAFMKAYKPNLSFNEINDFDNNWEYEIDFHLKDTSNLALSFEIDFEANDTTYYKDKTYVLMLGMATNGDELGYKKISLLYTYQNFYYIHYANLDGTEEVFVNIEKDNTLNYVYYSFNNGGEIVNVEPDKTTWDFLFSRTTELLFANNEPIPYSVVSVLLNSFSVKAYVEKEMKYKDINLESIKNDEFINLENTIGHSWKYYDLDNAQYLIVPDKYYVIQDINNYYYKLKFLSFLDPETNIKGTISFEYELLK